MNSSLFLVTFLVFLPCALVEAVTCPWSNTTLVKYSTIPAWNVRNANVTISANQHILLDVSPPPLGSLNISGELVFNNQNINLTTNWIKVNSGGSLIAGSTVAGCAISAKIIVTLTGDRTANSDMGVDPYDGGKLGSKGIAITTGGTLNLIGKTYGASWSKLKANAVAGTKTLTIDDVVTWPVGSKIVVATTDFSEVIDSAKIPATSSIAWRRGKPFADQTEVVTVASISGNTITLVEPLQYLHWGRDYERAEVGLLTRHIVIQGDESSLNSSFGGHLIMRHANLKISGTEFTRMGQKGAMGRYPVHFHFGKYSMGNYASDNSIHDNFQRCLVIHATDGILVNNNVAYNTNGHCYFLEDGAETLNTFKHNLGIKSVPVPNIAEDPLQIIPSDASASIFWITNPNNTFVNNSAVGGRWGFWFSLPERPTGMSAAEYADTTTMRPRCLPLLQFDDNTAHSSNEHGIQIDQMELADGTSEDAGYTPKQGPYDAKSASCGSLKLPPVEAVFNRIVAYKNRINGIWSKYNHHYIAPVLLDNRNGVLLGNNSVVENAIIVGETDNIGTPLPGHARSYSDPFGSNTTQILGFESYDFGGPQLSKNNKFINFTTTQWRKAGAFGSHANLPFVMSTLNKMMGTTLVDSNPYTAYYTEFSDHKYNWVGLDMDGSATQVAGGGWFVANNTFLINSTCTPKPEWSAYFCPPFAEGFMQISIMNNTGKPNNIDINGVDRTPGNGRTIRGTWYMLEDTAKLYNSSGNSADCALGSRMCWKHQQNLWPRRSYTFRWGIMGYTQATPTQVSVTMGSQAPGDWVILALPYPASALPITVADGKNNLAPASSYATLTTSTYYWDSNTEHLYIMNAGGLNDITYFDKWGNTQSNSAPRTLIITASCSNCVPTKLAIPQALSPPKVEEQYTADLQVCQVNASHPDNGKGKAFFFFEPSTQLLTYAIYHNLTSIGKTVTFYEGAYGKVGIPTFTASNRTSSPIRGMFQLTAAQWNSLVTGNMYVQLATTSYPSGHIRGQIYCSGATCSVPNADLYTDGCAPSYSVFPVYNDSIIAPWENNSTTNGDLNDIFIANSTTGVRCGKYSYRAKIQRGSVAFSIAKKANAFSANSTMQMLEFYVKAANSSLNLKVFVTKANGTDLTVVTLNKSHMYKDAIDSASWTRVRIPLSQLGTTNGMPLSKVTFSLVDTANPREFYLDYIRFTANGNVSKNASINVPSWSRCCPLYWS